MAEGETRPLSYEFLEAQKLYQKIDASTLNSNDEALQRDVVKAIKGFKVWFFPPISDLNNTPKRTDLSSAEGTFTSNTNSLLFWFVLLKICERLVDQAGIFSSNERLDDVQSSHLKYVMTTYYLAMLELKVHDGMQNRSSHLRRAKQYFNEYLHHVEQLEMISSEVSRCVFLPAIVVRNDLGFLYARIGRFTTEKEA